MGPDDGDDDGLDPVPPPEARPWRHPSELGTPAGGATSGGAPRQVTPADLPAPLPAGRPTRTWLVALLSGAVGAALTMAVVVGLGGFRRLPAPPAGVERYQTDLASDPDAPIAIAEKVTPAVARLDVTSASGPRTGTAVVFRSSGYLLTTADLVDGAEQISASLQGQPLPASVVGADAESDLAVIKVDAPNLSTTVLGRPAAKLQLGEPVIAVEPATPRPVSGGEPGLSVPVGVINNLNQRLESDDTTRTSLYGMIQTNLRSSPLAAGAPLIDANGAMVGVVTNRGGTVAASAEGTGATLDRVSAGEPSSRFAIPIDYAKSVADALISDGKVTRAWLGVIGRPLTSAEAAQAGVAGGLKVSSVEAGSPAADAKLQVDDIIVRLEDKPIGSIDDLVVTLRLHRPGDYVSVYRVRPDGGDPQPVFTTLRERGAP